MSKLINRARISLSGQLCEQCCDCEAIENALTEIRNEIEVVKSFIYLSDVRDFLTNNGLFRNTAITPNSGPGVSVINAGNAYNFWGTNSITRTGINLANNTQYYIIDHRATVLIPELQWYQGDSTIGTVWVEIPGTPNSTVYAWPLRFDSTGIYFTTLTALNNLPIVTTFKFTQALILVEPTVP
ncbi:MAG: hypothetical protein FWE31_04735 [Firmicutes bacterium]|nr:hypothetical protein [Bacillota bacterium]